MEKRLTPAAGYAMSLVSLIRALNSDTQMYRSGVSVVQADKPTGIEKQYFNSNIAR
jgi:hypothetical protein